MFSLYLIPDQSPYQQLTKLLCSSQYVCICSINITSTDQKLMCPNHFQSLLVYLTISNSTFKSNYNKASPCFRPLSVTRCMANCKPLLMLPHSAYVYVACTGWWQRPECHQTVRPIWCLVGEHNLPYLFAPQPALFLLTQAHYSNIQTKPYNTLQYLRT